MSMSSQVLQTTAMMRREYLPLLQHQHDLIDLTQQQQQQQQWWKKKTNMDEFINCIAFFLLEKLEYKIKYKHFLFKK